MKKFSSTFILLGITVLVILYAYFFEFKKRNEDESAKEKQALILDLSKEQITSLHIVSEINNFTLKKDSKNSWNVTEPVEDTGDASAIGNFIDSLAREKSDMEISDEGLDLASFGLDKPSTTIDVGLQDGRHVKVSVGKAAIGSKQYLRLNDEKRVLIGSTTWKTFGTKTVKEFRNKDIFHFGNEKVQAFTIESPKFGKQTLRMKGDLWVFDGKNLDLDKNEIERYLGTVRALKATDFVTENKKDVRRFGLNQPQYKIEMTLIEGPADKPTSQKTVSLHATAIEDPKTKQKEVYVLTSDSKPVFKIYSSTFDMVEKSVNDFRDKTKPFKFAKEDIKEIGSQTDLLKVTLVKEGPLWSLKNPVEDKEADQAQIKNFLDKLSELRAKTFLGSKKSFTARRTVVLKSGKGDVVSYSFSEEQKGKGEIWVNMPHFGETIAVEASTVSTLPAQTLLMEKAPPKPVTTQPSPPKSAPSGS